MTTSGPAPAYAVTCYTCLVKIWEGDTAPTDGQVVMTTYADSVPGTACPSKIDPCPNKSAVVNARPAQVTAADIIAIKARLDKIEAKVKP